MDLAHPGSPPSNVESKVVGPDAHKDGDLLEDADHTDRSGDSSEQVDREAHAADQLDLVVVGLQSLLVDVEAEGLPVLVSALHRLHQLLCVCRKDDDPEREEGDDHMRMSGHEKSINQVTTR